jgi:phosphoribosyl-ATP pyrophosphohydrolase
MIIQELFETILSRKAASPESSYTARLFVSGEDEIVKKIGEEAVEVILAAKGQGNERLVEETADLAYHLLVLLAYKGLSPADVEAELMKRRK